VAAERADDALAALAAAGVPSAVIGAVVGGEPGVRYE
jgi:hydrogenase maturation factor